MKKVAYILDIFPTVSETFVINEILAVLKEGVDVVIFSRKKGADSVRHTTTEKLLDKVRYFDDPKGIFFFKIVWAHIDLFVHRPVAYLKTLFFALRNQKRGLLWFFKVAGCYAKQLRKENVDHIHAHFASVSSEYAMLISLFLGIPHTFTAHGWHDIYEYPPYNFYDRAKFAKKVITISKYNRNYLQRTFGIPKDKISVVHCGIKPEIFTHNRNGNGDGARIFSVARLHPIKGVEYLIRACKILKERGCKFNCSIVGDGEQKEEMTELIGRLNVADVVSLEGAKTADEVREGYNNSDIYVQSSLCEGLSVSVMEAMASELAIVATSVTGIAELIEDGRGGYLVESQNETALANAIEKLVHESNRWESIGSLNRQKIVKDFTLNNEVKKLIEVWFHD